MQSGLYVELTSSLVLQVVLLLEKNKLRKIACILWIHSTIGFNMKTADPISPNMSSRTIQSVAGPISTNLSRTSLFNHNIARTFNTSFRDITIPNAYKSPRPNA